MKKPLTIGVDATPLTKPLAGVGQYTYFLLKEMLSNSSHHWILFIDKKLPFSDFNHVKNVQFVCYNKPGKWSNLIWRLLFLPLYLKKYQIEVFWSPCNILPFFKRKSTKYLITFHDMVHKIFPHTMSNLGKYKALFFYGNAIKKADLIITPTKAVAQEIAQYYPFAAQKIKSIWHGAQMVGAPSFDDSVNKAMVSLAPPADGILFIGTREPRKNLDRLIEAYALLPSHLQQQYPLIICGDTGWKTQSLYYKIKTLQLEEKIFLTGYLPSATRDYLLQNAAVLVMPSLYEGFGLPVIEAMEYGLPLVLSNIPVFHEIAAEAALFIDPYNPVSIANTLQSILLDPVLQSNLKEKSKNRAKYFQGWNRSAMATLSAIENLRFS